MKKFIYIFLLALITTSCLKDAVKGDFNDDSICGLISIKVNAPSGHSFDMNGMVVNLIDAATGMTYDATVDANGEAQVKVAYGSYIASTEHKELMSAGKIAIYNGSTARITVTPNNRIIKDQALNLNFSQSGQIIIKEIYYGGCKNPSTGKAYTGKDTYLSLYNNSGDIAYLDSLCVSCVDPYNAPSNGTLSDWVKQGTSELRDSVPGPCMHFMFNGTGKDIPLEPGQEAIVCLNAIDHSASVSTSVDLSNPNYFALYESGITTIQSAPAPGVKTLKCIWKAGTPSFIVSVSSPGLFIYSLGGKSVTQFVEDCYSKHPKRPGSRVSDVLLIDKSLVLDGVECFSVPTQTKRFRPEIDMGYAIITGGTGTGKSIHRKVDEDATSKAGGRVVYMDTNNSTNDFEVLDQPTIKK